MKYEIILLSSLLSLSFTFGVDFDRYLRPSMPLMVVNVDSDDTLNLRINPNTNAKIIAKIPPNSRDLSSNNSDTYTNDGKWLSVRYGLEDGFIDGWVKAKFVKVDTESCMWQADNKTISTKYPCFLTNDSDEESLKFYFPIDIKHYSRCNIKNKPKVLEEYKDFTLSIKIIPKDRKDEYKRLQLTKEKYHGYDAFKNNYGSEECGVNRYFINVKDKVLLVEEPYEKVEPILLSNYSLIRKITPKDRYDIVDTILKNLSFPK